MRSCSQIVDREQLDGRAELGAIHKESYDGLVQEHGFGKTNSSPCETLDPRPQRQGFAFALLV